MQNIYIDIEVKNRQKRVPIGRRERDAIRRAAESAFKLAAEDMNARAPAFVFRRAAGSRRTPPQAAFVLTDDAGIKEANLAYRGIDGATDVLSFPQFSLNADDITTPAVDAVIADNTAKDAVTNINSVKDAVTNIITASGARAGGVQIGEVLISAERASGQAEEYGHGFDRELGFLAAHGMLHLLGYDHGADGDGEMRGITERALTDVGLPRTAQGTPDGFRSGFVAVVGRPNVGKSTLINILCGNALSIVSDKPQTTRRNARMILTTESYQMVFVDTPGLHIPKNRLGEQMVRRAKSSVKDADAVLLMVDARERDFSAENREVLQLARSAKIPVALIINKVDLVIKEKLLPLIARLSAQFDFACVIPISATSPKSRGVVVAETVKLIPPGEPLYPEDMITDQTSRRLVEDIIREKALKMLDQEIPHGIDVEVERFRKRERDGLYEINATVYCEREAHKKIIIGSNGDVLKKIGVLARPEIERLQNARVFLSLWVKVRKDWRDNDAMLRRMGYFDGGKNGV